MHRENENQGPGGPGNLVPVKDRPGGKAFGRIRDFHERRGIASPVLATTPIIPESSMLSEKSLNPRALPDSSRDQLGFGKAFAQKMAIPNVTPVTDSSTVSPASPGPTWTFLGPDSIPAGQTYGTGGNNKPAVSGRIAGVAVQPTNPDEILLATAGGGIWRSQGNL